MKLEQLSPENISAILEKKLCLVQASKKYIEELDQKYGVLNNIEMIIRKTVKENSLMILDKTIPLYEYSYLDTICTDEYCKGSFFCLGWTDKTRICVQWVKKSEKRNGYHS